MIVSHTTAEDRVLSVEVREATVRDMLKRTALMRRAATEGRDADDEADDIFMTLLRLNTYPACIACASGLHDSESPALQVESLDFDTFLDLPEQFMTAWISAAYELNPAWSPDAVVPQMRLSSEPETNKSDSTND